MALFSKKPEASASDQTRQKLQEQTAQELAVADVTELVNNMTRNCFDLCYPAIGSTPALPQTKCTEQCVKKYMAAWDTLSQSYFSRLQGS